MEQWFYRGGRRILLRAVSGFHRGRDRGRGVIGAVGLSQDHGSIHGVLLRGFAGIPMSCCGLSEVPYTMIRQGI